MPGPSPWPRLQYQHTQAVRAWLAEHYAPATANKFLAALRGVQKESFKLGLMSPDDYARAREVEGVKGTTLPAGREVTPGELVALFRVCAEDPTPAGARDAALLALLYGGGLRRSEAVALRLSDYAPETGTLTVRAGKGRKARTGHATNGAADALAAWLDVRGTDRGALLCPVDKAGRLHFRRMTDQAVLYILRKRAQEAGVAHCTPHDLRRSFISHLLDRGADISTVQRMAGHANVTTTARYDRRGEEAKRKAAALLVVPFVRRSRSKA
jgi:site-specific recombinase XerD